MRLLLMLMTFISGSLLVAMSVQQYRLRQSPSTAAMLAFVDDRPGDNHLYLLSPSNPRPNILTTGYSLYQIDYAPDGTWLVGIDTASVDDNAVVRYDIATGLVTRLGNLPGNENGPVISPDGTQIAFSVSDSKGVHLYVMNADGTNVRQLTTDGNQNHQPTWTPDGRALIFSRSTGFNMQLYRYNLADGTLQAVTSNSTLIHAQAAVSSDGRWIAYTAYPLQDRTRRPLLYILSLETAISTQLTFDDDVVYSPTWSVDGAWIYFSRPDSSNQNDIFRIRHDASITEAVTQTTTINETGMTIGPPIDAGGSVSVLGIVGAVFSISSVALWGSASGWGWALGLIQATTATQFAATSADRISTV